jgi:hypothetical protein
MGEESFSVFRRNKFFFNNKNNNYVDIGSLNLINLIRTFYFNNK